MCNQFTLQSRGWPSNLRRCDQRFRHAAPSTRVTKLLGLSPNMDFFLLSTVLVKIDKDWISLLARFKGQFCERKMLFSVQYF